MKKIPEFPTYPVAINDNLVPTMLRGYIAAIFAPPGIDVETDEVKLNAFRETIHQHCQILDNGLAGRTYLAGDSISIADLLLTPVLHYLGIPRQHARRPQLLRRPRKYRTLVGSCQHTTQLQEHHPIIFG